MNLIVFAAIVVIVIIGIVVYLKYYRKNKTDVNIHTGKNIKVGKDELDIYIQSLYSLFDKLQSVDELQKIIEQDKPRYAEYPDFKKKTDEVINAFQTFLDYK